MTLFLALVAAATAAAAATPAASPAPAAIPPHYCRTDSGYRLLDFWAGTWEVRQNGELQGTNVLEPALDGCALLEHWRGADGQNGEGIFYRELASGEWRNVWVTDQGPVKERRLVKDFPGPGVRFAGEIRRRSGGVLLDRVTMTPLPNGTLRQVIEQSTDGGASWFVPWEAVYKRQ
jgi:hypothetical protein